MNSLRLDRVAATRGGRTVLHDVSLHLAPGTLAAIIGPNGAGKSTLLQIAAGLLAPAAGTVELDGTPLARIPRRDLARRRAYLPQRAGIDWPIGVADMVALGLAPSRPAFGPMPPHLAARIDRALIDHDLSALGNRPATSLSGGELARAMLARATVGDAPLLIVDEPVAGLDPAHAIDAVRRLRALADGGTAILMAIHDLDLTLAFADRVVALRDGRMLAAGETAAVMTPAVLTALFDMPARLIGDPGDRAIRFTG
jgi:iron complex transport system ATP-binding protein